MNHEYLIDAFITKLQEKDISYAIITGKYEKLGVAEEKKERNFVEDLDIVFFDTTEEIIHRHLIEMGLKQISHHTYKFQKNGYELPVDIFIDFINSGYYYLFPIDKNNLTIKNNRICISEHDYILYQILEPLIKFSGYKKRHFVRLRKYFMNGCFSLKIKNSLCKIIGCYFSDYLIRTIEANSTIDKKMIRFIKVRLLFNHKNIFRMLKQRLFL